MTTLCSCASSISLTATSCRPTAATTSGALSSSLSRILQSDQKVFMSFILCRSMHLRACCIIMLPYHVHAGLLFKCNGRFISAERFLSSLPLSHSNYDWWCTPDQPASLMNCAKQAGGLGGGNFALLSRVSRKVSLQLEHTYCSDAELALPML